MRTLACEIAESTGLDGRPSYWSGYGANLTHIGVDRLVLMHERIEKQVGASAAQEFAKMVVSLESLAAATFLQALYDLEARGWTLPKEVETPSKMADPPRSFDDDPFMKGVMVMAGAMTASSEEPGRDVWATQVLRASFAARVGIDLPLRESDKKRPHIGPYGPIPVRNYER